MAQRLFHSERRKSHKHISGIGRPSDKWVHPPFVPNRNKGRLLREMQTQMKTKSKPVKKQQPVGQTFIPYRSELLPAQVRDNLIKRAEDLSMEILGRKIIIDLDSYIVGLTVGSRDGYREFIIELPKKRGKMSKGKPKKNSVKQALIKTLTLFYENNKDLLNQSKIIAKKRFQKTCTSVIPAKITFETKKYEFYFDGDKSLHGNILQKNKRTGKTDRIPLNDIASGTFINYLGEARKIILDKNN